MNELVIVDSQIFIWGIKREDNNLQREDVQRSRTLIQILERERKKIVVPAPQLAELLSGCTPDKRQDLLSFVSRRYQVLPFDSLSALKFGELLHKTLKDEELKAYFKEKNIYKARMKFDCMIVATGITRGISTIYSHDKDLKKYADGQISIKDLTNIPVQIPMFEDTIEED
jgi:predicted nucleic acid-binding protein